MTEERELQELSLEAIAREPWNAVYLQLPDSPSPELLKDAHYFAQYCYRAASSRAEKPDGHGRSPFEPQDTEYGPDATAAEHAKNALKRIEELERIDPTLVRLLHPEPIGDNKIADLKNINDETSHSAEIDERREEHKQPDDRNQPAEKMNAKTEDHRAGKTANVEVSDRMSRMLDADYSEDNDLEKSDDHEKPGDRDFGGGGHSRTR